MTTPETWLLSTTNAHRGRGASGWATRSGRTSRHLFREAVSHSAGGGDVLPVHVPMSTVTKPVPFGPFDPDLRSALVAMVRKRVPESEVEDIVQQALAEAIESPHAPHGQRVAPPLDLRRREEQGRRLPPSRGTRELRSARRRGHAGAARRGRPPSLGREEPPRGRREQEDARLDAARRRGREARVDRRVREAAAAARSPARQPPAPPLQGELAARGRDARRARRHRQRDRDLRPPQAGARDHHPRGRRSARRADASSRAREVRERATGSRASTVSTRRVASIPAGDARPEVQQARQAAARR